MIPLDFSDLCQVFIRLLVAMFLGGLLGIDRDLHRKPAGVRVLALVCLGASAIVMVSVMAVSENTLIPAPGVVPAIQGVLSGIGFLGAGVILHDQGKDEVHGIATAASIWIAAIIGMICGLGHWRIACFTFGLAWFILTVGRWIEVEILKIAVTQTKSPLDVVTHENKSTT